MNLLLVEAAEVGKGGLVRLAGRRGQHLRRVLRVAPGRRLRAGVLGGAIGEAEVVEVAGGEVVVRLEAAAEPGPEVAPRVDLVVALPRPAVLHRVLQNAAAMGIGRLELVNAWRVEKSFFASPALAEEAIRRHLVLGAEQGMTTRLPTVRIHPLLVPFLAELAAAPAPPARLLAHPGAPEAIETAVARLAAGAERWQLAIGPEGGWIDREVESFSDAGFAPVALGPWVLRLEAAVTAAVAQLEVARRVAGRAPARGGEDRPC